MPIYKTKNENFFKKWSPEMAYVLGFFTADGSMYKTKRGTYFIEFQITDGDLLEKIRELLGSNHKITKKRRNRTHKIIYRLQIGSKEIFKDLSRLGLAPNKSKTLKLPLIPDKYFRHFLRGYFDGDGNVIFSFFKKAGRKNLSRAFLTRFTSGSKDLLVGIQNKLSALLGVRGSLSFYSGAWRLSYSANDSKKLSNFMYENVGRGGLIYLPRKHKIFLKADRHYAGVA